LTGASGAPCPFRQQPFFRGLDERQRQWIADWTKEHRAVRPRRAILESGQVGTEIFALHEGWAFSYVQLPGGVRQIVHVLLPGDIFGFQGWLGGSTGYSVQALTPASLCALQGRSPQELFAAQPDLALALVQHALRLERRTLRWLARLARADALHRTAYLILDTFERLRARGLAEGSSCAFPLQFQHLADALGLSRAHLARTLQELRERKWAAIEANTLVIHDAAALAERCAYQREDGDDGLVII
jgi:CRP-like cAMP-binding protein